MEKHDFGENDMAIKPDERFLTIMDIVSSVQDATESDDEAVAVIAYLLTTGRLKSCTPRADAPAFSF